MRKRKNINIDYQRLQEQINIREQNQSFALRLSLEEFLLREKEDNLDPDAIQAVRIFIEEYFKVMGEPHPNLKPDQWQKILETILECEDDHGRWHSLTSSDLKPRAERQRSFKSKQGFIKQLLEAFGNLPLRRFNTMLIEQFQAERMQKGNKPATINRLLATIKHMFTKAVEWDMVEEETLKRIRRVKLLPENNRRLRYLSKEECQNLINACNGDTKPIVITALNSDMRKGEILSLKWDNVDLRHGFILLDTTKNGERREIPINETVRATLQGLERRLDIPYVFYDKATGKPFQDVKRSFNTALRKAGIKDFHFHDLRHTFASHLAMSGVDITTVSRLLGHKSLTMTLRYAHLAPEHMTKALNLLDSTLNEKPISTKLAQFGFSR